MKTITTLFAVIIIANTAFAQQDPQFTQYMHNKLFYNPAYAGIRNALCFTVIGRQQWSGFAGAPRTGVFSADMVTPDLHGGIGLNVMYDQLGFEDNTRYNFNYSFHLEQIWDGVLAFGLDFGAYSKRVGPQGLEQWQATSNWQIDGSIPPQLKSTKFDIGFGLWYQQEKMWLGISVAHLPATAMQGLSSNNQSLSYQIARHYFITGGYSLHPSPTWEIRPSFIVKSDATISSFDFNATAIYKNAFWFGASYRYQDAICPMIGIQLKDDQKKANSWTEGGLKIGFAYDYTTSAIRSNSNGSFELFINYCMPIPEFVTGHGDSRIFDKP
jgi:type IX secretion system PorP/SprF family membrane protein